MYIFTKESFIFSKKLIDIHTYTREIDPTHGALKRQRERDRVTDRQSERRKRKKERRRDGGEKHQTLVFLLMIMIISSNQFQG